MKFKDRIKSIRMENDVSLAKLAAYLNKSESAVRAWEIERSKPDADTLIKLAKYFDCTTDYLLGINIYRNEKEKNDHFLSHGYSKKKISIRRAVYAGTFDPFTNGHMHVFKCAEKIFDDVTILFANNPEKERWLPVEEMIRAIQQEIHRRHSVVSYDGLIAEYCKAMDIKYIVRGLRNPSDYFYEETMAKINKEINPELETIYFRADNENISSSMIKTLIQHKVNVKKYIPYTVYVLMRERGMIE